MSINGRLLSRFPEGVSVQQSHQFRSRFGCLDIAGDDFAIFEPLSIEGRIIVQVLA
jgi:hypothetical protein